MADSPNYSGGMLDEFRRKIGDTTYSYVQCEVSCDDQSVTTALVEVTDGHFLTTITGGTAADLDFDLLDPQYDTIEKLVNAIRGSVGYFASVAQDGEGTHASDDLEIIAPKDFKGRRVQLRSRRWSDAELEEILDQTVARLNRDLNKQYDTLTVPSSLKDLLFLLAQVGVYWDQINNATKRRGLDLRVDDFRTLHQAALDEYERALKAYLTTQQDTLTEEELDDMGAGQVIVGTQFRRSLRTMRMTPGAVAPFPAVETLLASFIGGGKIRLDWTRSRTDFFSRYEIWRGTDNTVSNGSEISRPAGALPVTGTKIATVFEVQRTLWVDGGTSPLPPGTYFYRLYTYNVNGDFSGSSVVSATVT